MVWLWGRDPCSAGLCVRVGQACCVGGVSVHCPRPQAGPVRAQCRAVKAPLTSRSPFQPTKTVSQSGLPRTPSKPAWPAGALRRTGSHPPGGGSPSEKPSLPHGPPLGLDQKVPQSHPLLSGSRGASRQGPWPSSTPGSCVECRFPGQTLGWASSLGPPELRGCSQSTGGPRPPPPSRPARGWVPVALGRPEPSTRTDGFLHLHGGPLRGLSWADGQTDARSGGRSPAARLGDHRV